MSTVSPLERLAIVELDRRCRWSEDEKFRVVMASQAAPRLVSATARRHGISRLQLLAWRRALKAMVPRASRLRPSFPVVLAPEPAAQGAW